jgi:hypothetical protein
MIKNREEIEKEFFNDFGNTGAWEELDNIALYISKIRQDDIDELVEWVEKKRDVYDDDVDVKHDKYRIEAKNGLIDDFVAYLQELKTHI